jgi:hypothetical protein
MAFSFPGSDNTYICAYILADVWAMMMYFVSCGFISPLCVTLNSHWRNETRKHNTSSLPIHLLKYKHNFSFFLILLVVGCLPILVPFLLSNLGFG